MKKTITLGLLVFFVGLLMTACGSDSSSSPTAAAPTNTNTDNSNTPVVTGLPTPNGTSVTSCSSTCGQTQTVTLVITHSQAFAALVGLNTSGGTNNGLNNFNMFNGDGSLNFGGLGNTIVNCGLGIGMAWLINELFNANTVGGCGGVTTTTTTNTGSNSGVSVASSYRVDITPYSNNVFTGAIHLGNGQLYSFELRPNSNGNFWEDINKNPAFGMTTRNGGYELVTMYNGAEQVVGYLTN